MDDDQLARLEGGRLEGVHVSLAKTLTIDCLLVDDRPFTLAVGPVVHFFADGMQADNVVEVAILVGPNELGPEYVRRLVPSGKVGDMVKDLVAPKCLVVECANGFKLCAVFSWVPGTLAIEAPEKRWSLPPQA